MESIEFGTDDPLDKTQTNATVAARWASKRQLSTSGELVAVGEEEEEDEEEAEEIADSMHEQVRTQHRVHTYSTV